MQLPFYIPSPGGDRPRHVLGGTGCSSVSDTSLKCGAPRSTCAAGHGCFPQFRQHVLGTPHPPTGSASSSTHWCHPGDCQPGERLCLIRRSGSLRGLRGRVMPVPWLIHAGEGVPCVICQCLTFKNVYLPVFPEGKDNSVGAEEAKVWFVILRKSSWVTLK